MVVFGHIQPKLVNLHLKKCTQNRAERAIGNLRLAIRVRIR